MTSFKVEVKTAGDSSWAANGLRHQTREGAEAYARDLEMRWLAVTEWRVVESDDEPTRSRTTDWAERGTPRPDDDAPERQVRL